MKRLFLIVKNILTIIASTILSILTVIIIISIFSRFMGISLHWYDEVSAILLAWLTFYGAALCALNRSHMGFGNLVAKMPLMWKKVAFIVSETLIIAFFTILAWAGLYLLSVFGDETLTSLDFIPLAVAQSALPIGCILFILAEILSMSNAWKSLLQGKTMDDEEIEQAIRSNMQTASGGKQ
ncbi:TRAP transporter small permease [Lonepinella sp. BR2930]|uniref:TRAP transporter small permease n=1 Tax=Lonepinella sp. BR2930 TaxID=3434554 RepID=UPI003F6DD081